jgi:uncharacterized protein (TIGR02808 family)
MSTLESIFWHVLGYSAIPIIFIVGFLFLAVAGCFLVELAGYGAEEPHDER